MSDRRPYSRVYWSVLDDSRFENIRSDMRHFGSWSLMLVVADMAYPAPAFVPPTVPKRSLDALTECGLVELVSGGLFRIHGLAKERETRRAAASGSASVRWADGMRTVTKRDANASQTGPERDARRGLDEDETRQDETSTARDAGLDSDETRLFALLSRNGAFIRPESGLGVRLVGLIDRRGIEPVLKEAERLAAGERLSDRQWVFGLEAALEAIPIQEPKAVNGNDAERSEQIRRRMFERRTELFRRSGMWLPEWGEQPVDVA